MGLRARISRPSSCAGAIKAPEVQAAPNTLLLAGAHVLEELVFVRLPAHTLRASDQLAVVRVARSRNAGRYAASNFPLLWELRTSPPSIFRP